MRVLHKRSIPTVDVECEHCQSRLRIEKRDLKVSAAYGQRIGGLLTKNYWVCSVCEHENYVASADLNFKQMVD